MENPKIKRECLNKECPNRDVNFDEVLMIQKNQHLIEGKCYKCGQDQVIIYVWRTDKVLHHAREITRERTIVEDDGSEIDLTWKEWLDKDGKRVGHYVDGCFRLDMGSFHLANKPQLESEEEWHERI